ncbi:protein FAR1-RELATED SEQUENCE 10-like, partial [Trifolium medium]|nr:protein FAR1-RELATED SEQUENCE 10-like [Trifolium medium]
LIMDLTYKSNKYRLPLLEFVGSTSTGETYAITFAMTSEKEDNFVWTLQSVRNSLQFEDNLKVIVTNRDQALMKAIDTIFPKCTALLGWYHIRQGKFHVESKIGKEKKV